MALNVIFVSPEAAPFCKTGGLADVSGALPAALKKLGCNVTVFLPYYRTVEDGNFQIEDTGLTVTVQTGVRKIQAGILAGTNAGVRVFFLKRDEYYDRRGLYGTPAGDYFDNIERFAFFSRGVIEAVRELRLKADVMHCNDWQTGLVPAYIRDIYGKDPWFSKTATLFTIHNVAYQGVFPGNLYSVTGLSGALFTLQGLEFWGNVNLLKSGIVYSDIITTVSPAYSREIQTPEYGYGLEGALKHRGGDLYGIINGADYEEWDPATDKLLPANYSMDEMEGKEFCKTELLKKFSLKLKPHTPLIGIISRLADQKGFDILQEAMPELMKLDIGLVILGSGDKLYIDLLEALAAKYPSKLSVKIAFENTLAHLVEAGSDIFLMPSKYEPCGLNQLYSLRYGTVPVVRSTGGLEDTVRDWKEGGTGFKFTEYSAKALVGKVKEALTVYSDKKAWAQLQRNGMSEDFSWERSAMKYMELYRLARKKPPKTVKRMGGREMG